MGDQLAGVLHEVRQQAKFGRGQADFRAAQAGLVVVEVHDQVTVLEPALSLRCRGGGPTEGGLHPGGQLGRKLIKTSDVMHVGEKVPLLPDDATMDRALIEMSAKSFGCVGIVGRDGRLAGIITDGDLRRHMDERLPQRKVTDVMTHEVVTCSLSTPVDETMEQMTRGRFRHLPVIEDGALIGIVSIGDIVKHHIAEVELEVSAMRGYLASG